MSHLEPLTSSRLSEDPRPAAVCVSTSCRDEEWNRFVARSPHGFHEQTGPWSEVKAFYGWTPLRLTLHDSQGVIAGAQILVRTVRGRYRVGYASRGPVVPSADPKLIASTVEEIFRVARAEKLDYLAIAPPYDGRAVDAALRACGFRRKPEPLPPGSVMTATLLIDLSQDLNTLHAGLRMQVRQHIRLAQRKGVVVREGRQEDVETFRALMRSMCERRGVSPTPPESDFFQNLWTVFAPRGWVRIFLAEVENRPVAALLVVTFGNTARVWKVGWSGEYQDRRPNNLLYWEAICWARENGFRYFDMVGIERETALHLLRSEELDWAKVTGPSNFKIGYGGVPLVLPETSCLFPKPWSRLFYATGGRRLLESSRVAHLLERLSA